MTTLVSVILPTFNRAHFIPQALASIAAQTWQTWELIVVDDGSTDGTDTVVESSRAGLVQRVHYVRQENRGAYAARNVGLDHAGGEVVAFFDSDDLWRPAYLERCVRALERLPELDWVYTACRTLDYATGSTLSASTFYVDGRPRPFLALPVRDLDGVRLMDTDAALRCQLTSGLFAGLQNSVIRRHVFESARFWDDYRVVEDVQFLVRALSLGLRIGFIDETLVDYRVHDDNSSASARGMMASRLLPIFEEEVRGLERVRAETSMPEDVRALLQQALGARYFWRLGYSGYWQAGRRDAAMEAFRTGLRLSAFDWRMWKTYVVCRLRRALSM